MERFFKIKERGSSVGQETIGGLTTFLAMAYIVFVNPNILMDAGIPFTAGLTATCIGAAVMTLLMGVIANRPIALASGMGINAIVAYTICLGMGCDWRVAMAIIVVEGIVITLLVICGLRKAIMDAIPADLRRAIGIGIGLFIAFIGLKGGGIIIANASTFIGFGKVTDPACIVAFISVFVAIILHALNVRGGLVISIIAATIVAFPLGVTALPESWAFGLDFSAFGAPLQVDPESGVMAIAVVFAKPALLLVAFSLLMSDFFDTMGTVLAVGNQGEFADAEGNVEDIQPILMVDSLAAVAGGLFGASSITSFVESTSGAAAGARTGFSNVIIAILFIVCAFLAPVFGMIPSAATCGALVVVGFLMLSDIVNISWDKVELAFPAFLTISMIPFTYSITNGIGLGFISYVIIMLFKGKVAEVKPLMWVAAIAFLAMFIFG